MHEPEFEFQKLEVYQRALDLQPLLVRIMAQLPRGSGDLKNQLRRSERSIRLNIAEGSGRHRPGGKVERYRTARGSANECAVALARRSGIAGSGHAGRTRSTGAATALYTPSFARTSYNSSLNFAARSKSIAVAACFICSSRILAHCSRSTSSA